MRPIFPGNHKTIFVLLSETICLMSVKHQDQCRIVQDFSVLRMIIIQVGNPIVMRDCRIDYLAVKMDIKGVIRIRYAISKGERCPGDMHGMSWINRFRR